MTAGHPFRSEKLGHPPRTIRALPVSQTDALASRDLPRSSPVEAAYDAAVICLPAEMKLHRVAAQVADLRVRRVVVCKARDPVGIVSATDFARVVALS